MGKVFDLNCPIPTSILWSSEPEGTFALLTLRSEGIRWTRASYLPGLVVR